MVDKNYKEIGTPAMRIMEECGEVLKALGKGERFGWLNHHPDRPETTNLSELMGEVSDLVTAAKDLEKSIWARTR